MKKFFMATSLVATMLTLAACGSSNSEEASSTAAAGDEKVTLTFSWWGRRTPSQLHSRSS